MYEYKILRSINQFKWQQPLQNHTYRFPETYHINLNSCVKQIYNRQYIYSISPRKHISSNSVGGSTNSDWVHDKKPQQRNMARKSRLCDRWACPIYASLLKHKSHTFKHLYTLLYFSFSWKYQRRQLASIFLYVPSTRSQKLHWFIGNAPVVKSRCSQKDSYYSFLSVLAII